MRENKAHGVQNFNETPPVSACGCAFVCVCFLVCVFNKHTHAHMIPFFFHAIFALTILCGHDDRCAKKKIHTYLRAEAPNNIQLHKNGRPHNVEFMTCPCDDDCCLVVPGCASAPVRAARHAPSDE